MEEKQIERIINRLLSTGADFAESFYEKKKTKVFNFIDGKLDALTIGNIEGLGLRIAKEHNMYYASINQLDEKRIDHIIEELTNNVHGEVLYEKVKLLKKTIYRHNSPDKYDDFEIKEKLRTLDTLIRSKDKRINQVSLNLQCVTQTVDIANYTGLHNEEERIRTRLFIKVYFKDGDLISNCHYSKGMSMGNGIFDLISFDSVIDDLVKTGIDKLYAKPCAGKMMPVVIGPAFGGVIFHEACGHALEATSVADHLSVLSDDLNKKIASEKVTIIDDGTLDKEWGSTQIDDEGTPTKRNVLISKGILKGYLIDTLNSRKMHMDVTGSGRRQNYTFAPTSRMNNTFLAQGNDSLESMIESIDLGLFAKEMGGGCVSTETGDFNFSVDVAYMIRHGKLAECVKSASLIGNTKEILEKVESVGTDTELGQGMCGSISGSVPVNVGQPYIKISSILVGGDQSEE